MGSAPKTAQMLQISFMDPLIRAEVERPLCKIQVDSWMQRERLHNVDFLYLLSFWERITHPIGERTVNPLHRPNNLAVVCYPCSVVTVSCFTAGYGSQRGDSQNEQTLDLVVNSIKKYDCTPLNHQEVNIFYFFFAQESKLLMRQETWNADLLQLHDEGERSKGGGGGVWRSEKKWVSEDVTQRHGNEPGHFFHIDTPTVRLSWWSREERGNEKHSTGWGGWVRAIGREVGGCCINIMDVNSISGFHLLWALRQALVSYKKENQIEAQTKKQLQNRL